MCNTLEFTNLSFLSPLQGFSRVRVVLDRGNSVRSLRRVSWPWELLVGGVGGVMALLLGYSIICLVEVFYFFIVRWTEQCIDPTLDDVRRGAEQEVKVS